MANCTICGKPIELIPSAAERAAKFGGTPAHYTALFTEHSDCALAKRKAETEELMSRKCAEASFMVFTVNKNRQGGRL